MKLTIKTLQGISFEIDAEEDNTILQIKNKTTDIYEIPSDKQKLVFAGKDLFDTMTLKELNLPEKGFLVLLVSQQWKKKIEEKENGSDTDKRNKFFPVL